MTETLAELQKKAQIGNFGMPLTEPELEEIRRQLANSMEHYFSDGLIPNEWYHFAVSQLLWNEKHESDLLGECLEALEWVLSGMENAWNSVEYEKWEEFTRSVLAKAQGES